MPSQAQVQFANAERERLRKAEIEALTEAEMRRTQQAAQLQADRDAQQNAQQTQFAQMQAQTEAERQQQAIRAQQQSQMLAGGLQGDRDYALFRYGSAQQDQQQQFTMRRDQQQAGFRQQEQVQGANLQAQLSQIQLDQQDEFQLRKLKRAVADTDRQVRMGTLTPEEGALLRVQLETGINPLSNRAAQSEILRSQIQSQALVQQNEQQATLFAQRQQRIAGGAVQSIQTVFNPDTGMNERYISDLEGNLRPLESSSVEQARQMALIEQGQTIGQRGQLFPLQLEGAQAGIAQTRASTTATMGANQRAEAMLPGNVQHQQLVNQSLGQTMQMAARAEPGNLRHRELINENIVQHLQQGAELHPGIMQMQGAQLADLTQRTAHAAQQQPRNMQLLDANVRLAEIQANQEPRRFASEEEYRAAQTNLSRAHNMQVTAQVADMPRIRTMQEQVQNGQLRAQDLENEQRRAQTALLNLRINGGMTPELAMGVYDHAMQAIDRELASPLSAVNQRISRLPPAEQDAAVESYRTSELNRRLSAAREAMPRLTGPRQEGQPAANTPARSGNELMNRLIPNNATPEAMPPNPQAASSLEPIRGVIAEAYNAAPWYQRVHQSISGPNRTGRLGEMHDIVHAATRANRDMTPDERARYEELRHEWRDGNAEERRLWEQMRLPGEQPRYVGTPTQLRALASPLTEGIPGNSRLDNTHGVLYARLKMADLLNRAARGNRGLAPHEQREYERLRAVLGADRQNYGQLHDNAALPE